ncbi:MAG: peptidoglycan-binding domain-containing protein [Actinomycetota bacterium]
MSRRVQIVALPALALAVVTGLILADPLARLGGGEDVEPAVERDVTEIAVRTLSITNEADGEIVFDERRPVTAMGAGTITSIVDAGSEVPSGSVVFAIDETPTVALPGAVPAWRAMTVDDVGADVAQLEAALVDLGFDPDGEVTIDDTYTTATASMVERWQSDAGLAVTGLVDLGTVLFVPDGARLSSVAAAVGRPVTAGSELAVATSGGQRLVATIAAGLHTTIEVGDRVTARLPDRSAVEAVIVEMTASGDGTWLAVAALDDGGPPLPDGEAVPVTVSWTEVVADQVTTVLAGALTRLDTGVYAVEVIDDGGATSFVEVGIGRRSGSSVEIVTDLPVGTTVVAP